MVGHDAHPDVVVVVGAVALARELGRLLQDRVDLVDLVDAALALQQHRHPLETHAGVDVLLRQVAEDLEAVLARALTAQVLHEDEVPELHVPVAGLLDVASGPYASPRSTKSSESGPHGPGIPIDQ